MKKDDFGNIIAKKEGSDDFSVMIAAHLDEIGFTIEKVDEEGFAYPSKLGGWDPRILPGNLMKGEKGWGIVSTSPSTLLSEEEKENPVGMEDLFLEGKNLRAGDFIAKDSETMELGNPNLLVGKGFDDRAGVAVLIETFRRLENKTDATVYGVGTVQEEVGLRGAGVTAYRIDPDLAIVLEVALADDVPAGNPHTPVVELGEGPAVTVKDASMISHQGLNEFMIQTAEEEDIPLQLEILDHAATDAGRIHLTREV